MPRFIRRQESYGRVFKREDHKIFLQSLILSVAKGEAAHAPQRRHQHQHRLAQEGSAILKEACSRAKEGRGRNPEIITSCRYLLSSEVGLDG